MFRLRPVHETALAAVARADVQRRIAAYLRKEHHGAVAMLRDDALSARIDCGINRAAAFGISGDTALMAYVGLMFTVSPRFDEHVRVIEVLRDDSNEPDRRIFILLRTFEAADWREVQDDLGRAPWDIHAADETDN